MIKSIIVRYVRNELSEVAEDDHIIPALFNYRHVNISIHELSAAREKFGDKFV